MPPHTRARSDLAHSPNDNDMLISLPGPGVDDGARWGCAGVSVSCLFVPRALMWCPGLCPSWAYVSAGACFFLELELELGLIRRSASGASNYPSSSAPAPNLRPSCAHANCHPHSISSSTTTSERSTLPGHSTWHSKAQSMSSSVRTCMLGPPLVTARSRLFVRNYRLHPRTRWG